MNEGQVTGLGAPHVYHIDFILTYFTSGHAGSTVSQNPSPAMLEETTNLEGSRMRQRKQCRSVGRDRNRRFPPPAHGQGICAIALPLRRFVV